MAEALERVQRKLGLQGKTVTENPGGDEEKSTLKEALKRVDEDAAAEIDRARVKKTTAELNLAAREAEARLRDQGGGKVVETNTGEKPKRWSVVDGKPIEDPDGEYESFAQAYKVAALDAAKASDPTTFFKFLKAEGIIGGKEAGSEFTQGLAKRYLDILDAQLKGTDKGSNQDVQTLRTEISGLRDEIVKMSNPLEIVTRAKALTEGLRSAGLIPEPTAAAGESIESVREKNRHNEKMEEIRIDRKYKKGLTDLAGEATESITKGIAADIKSRGGSKGAPKGGGLPYIVCSEKDCGAKIYITPETGNQVTCPVCETIYAPSGEVEPENE